MRTYSVCILLLLLPLFNYAEHHNGETPRNDSSIVVFRYQKGETENIRRLSYWDSLLPLARYQRLPLYESKILCTIGFLHSLENNMQKANENYLLAIHLAEKHKLFAQAIAVIKKLEDLSSIRLDRKASLHFIYRGLRLAEKINDQRSVIDFYASIGRLYFSSGEIDKALSFHFRCLDLSKKLGYDLGAAGALLDIGTDYLMRREDSIGIPYYLESKKYLGALGVSVYAVQVCQSLSMAHLHTNQFDSAYHYINRALEIARQLGNNRAVVSTTSLFAAIEHKQKKYKQAEQRLLESLELSKKLNFTAQLKAIYMRLKVIYEEQGDFKKALRVYEQQTALVDSLSGQQQRKQAIEKELTYHIQKKENEYGILTQEHEIQEFRLQQNRVMLLGMGALLVIVVLIAWLLRQRSRFRSEKQHMLMEQKLLLARMNPHFVFNSMNSIQQLVMNNENEKAETYLNKFANLIRGFLENSVREKLSVAEEVAWLHHYLGMESLRFGATFSYRIFVNENMDAEHTMIPHLMLQPFLENAIWHGLLPKKQNRELLLTITMHSPGSILCIIDDNGVGREASTQKKNTSSKKPLASIFTAQRISLIAKTLKTPGSISFTDKKDEEGNSLGTTVHIILPVYKI